jgi:hypothetical protein
MLQTMVFFQVIVDLGTTGMWPHEVALAGAFAGNFSRWACTMMVFRSKLPAQTTH